MLLIILFDSFYARTNIELHCKKNYEEEMIFIILNAIVCYDSNALIIFLVEFDW